MSAEWLRLRCEPRRMGQTSAPRVACVVAIPGRNRLARRAVGILRSPAALSQGTPMHETPAYELNGQSVTRERFYAEARAVARLTHPNVVTIHRVGEAGGRPFLVSELVRGESLDKLTLPIPSNKLRAIARGLARGLAAAHRRGVLHRDIKPANAVLSTEGEVKLLDFGVAKLLDDDGATQDTELTQLGGRAMTPQYASPEQVAGQTVGTASDVYSLGVIMYEMLVGKPPFTGAQGEILAKQIYEDPPPLAELAPWVTPDAAAMVHRLLNKSKAERPTMRQVSAPLDRHSTSR